MGRKRKPPRLWLDERPGRGWVILDGPRFIRTGCLATQPVKAQLALAEYNRKKRVGLKVGFVYFIDCGDYIKIGYTKSVQRRLIALSTSTPFPLTVLATIEGTPDTEAELHKRFATSLVKGEWFRKTPELLDYIEQIKKPSEREAA